MQELHQAFWACWFPLLEEPFRKCAQQQKSIRCLDARQYHIAGQHLCQSHHLPDPTAICKHGFQSLALHHKRGAGEIIH
jgi:hypothetical protein